LLGKIAGHCGRRQLDPVEHAPDGTGRWGIGLLAGGSPTKQPPPSSAAIYGGGGKSSAEKMPSGKSGIDGDSWRLPSYRVFTVFVLDFPK
jgi:hypothetical protein